MNFYLFCSKCIRKAELDISLIVQNDLILFNQFIFATEPLFT